LRILKEVVIGRQINKIERKEYTLKNTNYIKEKK